MHASFVLVLHLGMGVVSVTHTCTHTIQSPSVLGPIPIWWLGLMRAWWSQPEVPPTFTPLCVCVCECKSVIAFQLMDKWVSPLQSLCVHVCWRWREGACAICRLVYWLASCFHYISLFMFLAWLCKESSDQLCRGGGQSGGGKVSKPDMQTAQQNHKCHDLCNLSHKENTIRKWNKKNYNHYTDLHRLTMPAGIEQSPCLKFLLFDMNLSGTSCYYGKWATRLPSKPTVLTFISPGLLKL